MERSLMPDREERVGLVVGKFAPLHLGHMHLIETAQSEGHVVVAVYETPGYEPPAARRAEWIRTLFPGAEVLVLPDPDPKGDSEAVSRGYAEDFRRRYPERVTHVFSSEEYGERFARYLGAAHVPVDPERRMFPVSGSAARADPYAHRRFLHPLVYRSYVTKVCFVGAESTGKTTLAAAMADRFQTVWMPEYGRELFELKQGQLDFDDLLAIAKEHLRREEELILEANRFLFCDTNAVVTEFWCRFYFGRCDPELASLAAQVERDYVYVLCGDDISWEQDGWRETGGGAAWRAHQRIVRADLERRGLAYVEVTGTLEGRVACLADWLEERHPLGVPAH
jgi:HTH-type transcriptional regulator, transcriptional repressor of NAD biosynthesis genes